MKNLILLFCMFVLDAYTVEAQNSCRTPNGEVAECIPIKECPTLYDAVLTSDPQVVEFLQKSQCGYAGAPFVCCGTAASYIVETPAPESRIRRPDLLPTDCGIQFVDKILGGQNTQLNEFPWTALIGYRNASGFEQFSCGGTLINNKYIVTAAHCVKGRVLKVVGALHKVRLGEWNLNTDPDCFRNQARFKICSNKPEDRGIEEVIVHKGYSDTELSRYHDIALIRLNSPVQYTEFIKAVCLPNARDEVNIGERLTVVGWGRTENGIDSPVKLKVEVPVVSESACSAQFLRARVNIQDTQLCAGGEAGKDSCKGDSGGPLLQERSSRFYLAGLVSFGAECGTKNWPGIYTRLSAYRNWIERHIRD